MRGEKQKRRQRVKVSMRGEELENCKGREEGIGEEEEGDLKLVSAVYKGGKNAGNNN